MLSQVLYLTRLKLVERTRIELATPTLRTLAAIFHNLLVLM